MEIIAVVDHSVGSCGGNDEVTYFPHPPAGLRPQIILVWFVTDEPNREFAYTART